MKHQLDPDMMAKEEKRPEMPDNAGMAKDPYRMPVTSVNEAILRNMEGMRSLMEEMVQLTREMAGHEVRIFPPAMDEKYTGEVYKRDNGEEVPESEWVIFRVTDHLLPNVLRAYMDLCKSVGCSERHINGIGGLLQRVEHWQATHPHRVHMPD